MPPLRRMLTLAGFGAATIFFLVLGAGLLLRGVDGRRLESLVSANARGETLPDGKDIVASIAEYKAGLSVRVFERIGILTFLPLDAALCRHYFDGGDMEKAVLSCTDAIEAGKKEGTNVDLLIYNRGMAFARGAFEMRGAFSNAETDLKEVPDIGVARAYIEQMEILLAHKKERSSANQKEQEDARRGLKTPFDSSGGGKKGTPGY